MAKKPEDPTWVTIRNMARAEIVRRIKNYHHEFHPRPSDRRTCDCNTLAKQIADHAYMSREDGEY